MTTIKITWTDGTQSEIHSDRKMTKSAILGAVEDALKTGNVKEIVIK